MVRSLKLRRSLGELHARGASLSVGDINVLALRHDKVLRLHNARLARTTERTRPQRLASPFQISMTMDHKTNRCAHLLHSHIACTYKTFAT
jgi:hypothetical protein